MLELLQWEEGGGGEGQEKAAYLKVTAAHAPKVRMLRLPT